MATTAAVWAALLWWSGSSVAMAQQVPHHGFVGTAAVDGNPMANGTPVTAWINGDTVGESVVDGGTYTLLVVEPAGRSFDGKKISFKIGNLEAHQVGYWEQGGGTELHLTGTTSGSHSGEVKSTQGGTPESDRQESRLATRRLELKIQRELEQQRISRERQRADREAQLELDRQRLDPQYPDLGVFRIEGRQDQDRKPSGSIPGRIKSSGRGFFTNSGNGDVGAIDRVLDPTSLAVIGILLTLLATSTSLFKGN